MSCGLLFTLDNFIKSFRVSSSTKIISAKKIEKSNTQTSLAKHSIKRLYDVLNGNAAMKPHDKNWKVARLENGLLP